MSNVVSIRDKARAASLVKERVIDVPEWDCKLLVRGMTQLSCYECRAVFPEEGARLPIHNAKFGVAMVISHTFDPETKKPAFEAADMDWMLEMEPGIIRRIADEINVLSGFTSTKPVEDAAKNSEKTQPSADNSN